MNGLDADDGGGLGLSASGFTEHARSASVAMWKGVENPQGSRRTQLVNSCLISIYRMLIRRRRRDKNTSLASVEVGPLSEQKVEKAFEVVCAVEGNAHGAAISRRLLYADISLEFAAELLFDSAQ